MSKEDEDEGKRFQKGSDQDLSDGPIKKRCCTDIICIPIFIAHIIFFWILTLKGVSDGNPAKLVKPRDYRGDYCGVKEQWNDGQDLESFGKQIWSMNMTSTIDPIAKKLVCDTSLGYTVLSSSNGGITSSCSNCMSDADFAAYCGTSTSLTLSTDLAVDFAKGVESTFAEYTDPKKAFELFVGGGSTAATGIFGAATAHFNMVCVSKCDLSQNTSSSASQYTYEPDPTTVWGTNPSKRAIELWTKFVAEIDAAGPNFQGVKDQLNQFKFNTWSTADCPYTDRRYCVPMPGTEFVEFGSFDQCMPRVSGGVADFLSSTAVSGLEGIAQLGLTEDLADHAKTFGSVMGDFINRWDVIVIVAVCSFAMSLVALVLLRFCLRPVVWISLFLVFVIIAAGGFAMMTRANQCANASFVDSAKSQGEMVSNSFSDGTNPFEVDCPGGYSIESQTWRDILKYVAYAVLVLAVLWAIVIVCMCGRIALAISINQVAAQFMYHNPHVLFVPIIESLIAMAWVAIWAFCAAFLLSQVPADYVPTGSYATYKEASEACTEMFPAGDVFIDTGSTACTQNYQCYRCSTPRYMIDWRFGYSFFSFLWHNYFLVAVAQCTVAGAVGYWFFNQGRGLGGVCVGLKNALLWHTGSLAFGSLIIAIIVWIKWFLRFLAQQAKKQNNKVVACILSCLAYCVWCFEKCVKYLNKNAYIQIALLGTNFCKSAFNAFSLILRNAMRFGAIIALSYIVHFVMHILIVAATTVAGYFILQAMYPDVDPIIPTILYGFMGYLMAKLFMGTFGLAVDSTMQCFIAAEEMGTEDFVPPLLKKFVDDNQGNKGNCCSGLCCFT